MKANASTFVSALLLSTLMISGCTGASDTTPEGTIQSLFQYAKSGEMTAIGKLMSSGHFDNFDQDKIRKLLGSDKISAIETEVLNNENQRSQVHITLVVGSDKIRGKTPVDLVYKDGGWKIDYSGMNWPRALTTDNYSRLASPTSPTDLTATVESSSRVDISWRHDDSSIYEDGFPVERHEDGFRIERRTSTEHEFLQIDNVPANASTYSSTGLSPSTTYHYRVKAYNKVGDLAYSNEASATTFPWTMILEYKDRGAVSAIAFDPANPAIIYVGFAWTGEVGGLMKSPDGGMSWVEVNMGTADRDVRAIVIDPKIPSTIYAAANEVSHGSRLGGLLKSTDGGDSWAEINSGLPIYESRQIQLTSLLIDHQTPSTLYVGTATSGVFKTTDGGTSWIAANSGLPTSRNPVTGWQGYEFVNALAPDLAVSSTIYAATNKGVFKSTNGGSTWSPVNTDLPDAPVRALAISPSTPSTIFTATDEGIFKSTNGGDSWVAASAGLTDFPQSFAISSSALHTVLYVATADSGLFRSTDMGASWGPVNTDGLYGPATTIMIGPGEGFTVYAGTGGRLFKAIFHERPRGK